MFEKVDLEAKMKTDGTIAVNISFAESTWQSAYALRCINVGLLPKSKPIDMDPDMTDRESSSIEYIKRQDYRHSIKFKKKITGMVCLRKEQDYRHGMFENKITDKITRKITDKITSKNTSKITYKIAGKIADKIIGKITGNIKEKNEITGKITREQAWYV
ncbi:hypothetical protein AMTR_s00012p00070630 [Amborella trichopoda]|uniref:Toc75-like second POTRA domain-containing protein n=1 Tax=Amborella trichopoda TaxID=13333 RepID=W1PJB7_AMBTC|nr:hypothetical protein AMTR_s00012p00070630 [Amborella trichopoda]